MILNQTIAINNATVQYRSVPYKSTAPHPFLSLLVLILTYPAVPERRLEFALFFDYHISLLWIKMLSVLPVARPLRGRETRIALFARSAANCSIWENGPKKNFEYQANR